MINKRGKLSPEESHHALRVLRLQAGDLISVSQGDGKVYRAQLTGGTPKEATFEIEELLREEKKPSLKIAMAPTKSNDRFEFFLEKATELGIAEITPLLCHHSERKVYKEQRGEKIILSAVKQSKKGYFPKLNQLTRFADFLNHIKEHEAYIAHLNQAEYYRLNGIDLSNECWVLIGPEGDFSDQEISLALKQGIKSLTLGNEILRTETAGIYVAAAAALSLQ